MEDKQNSRFSSKPVTRARCVLSVLAVVMYHTNTITPTNATTLFPRANFSSRVKRDNEDPTHSCPLQLPTEVLQCVVGCAGVGISSVAMAQVTRGKHLNRPFRVLLSSLTVTDLAFSGSSFLLGSFAMYLSFDQDLQALLSTVCNVLTGAYHSLLICSAATSLALSVDRVLAVFEPVRYRVLAQKGKKLTIVVLTPWALAGLCLLTVPLTWHFYGNALQAHFTCWPLLAVKKEFLFLQGAVLLVCVLGITLAHFSLLYKLTRRAMLVVPMFGTRLSETTAVERRQTRRSVRHAGSQACTVVLVYLAMAPYVMWLADGSISLRLSKACEGHHLLLSLIPLVGTIINSLLTLWRFRDRPSSSTNTTQNCREMDPAPRSNVTSSNREQGLTASSSPLQTPSSSWKPHPDVPHPTETEEEQTKQESESECHPSCSEAQVEKKPGPADAEDEDTCGQSEGSDNSIWWPPEDEHYNDNCRADPCLLTMTVVTSTTKDRRTGGKVE